MKRKIKSKRGVTLVEMLIATVLMTIFVSMAAVGTSTLFGTGERLVAGSKAAVLGSDVLKVITNELRFGENFTLDETTQILRYNSTTYGDNCEMRVDASGQLTVVQVSAAAGADGTAREKTFFPIGSAAYDEVRVKSVAFTIAPSASSGHQTITCTLAVMAEDETTLWTQSVTVVPLYQKNV